jgi:hypothetical protein
MKKAGRALPDSRAREDMAATRSRDGSKAAPKAPSEEPGLGDLFFVDNKGSKVSKGKKGKKGESDVVKKASGKGAHVSTESSHEAEWERILFGVNAGADNDDNDDEEEADHASLSGPESADADADDDSGIASDNEPAHAQKGRQRTTRKGAAEKKDKKPVWHDDDDENLNIDLAGKDRLRKLRKSEEETLISGPEFAKRVREQAKHTNTHALTHPPTHLPPPSTHTHTPTHPPTHTSTHTHTHTHTKAHTHTPPKHMHPYDTSRI